MELDDFLLNRVSGNGAVDRDQSLLTDPVGPVGGLILDGRVPPRVHMDDVVGGGEIKPQSADLQDDQEQISHAGLKRTDLPLSLPRGGAAVQVG